MNYTIAVETSAERDLSRITGKMLQRIDAKLRALADDPRPRGACKLEGREGEGWRVRVGDYRILYTIDDKKHVVSVYRIRPRSKAYRQG